MTSPIITRKFHAMAVRVWSSGYMKDAPNRWARDKWRRLTILLCGGGTRRIDVREAISNTNPLWAWPVGDRDTQVVIQNHEPLSVEWNSEIDSETIHRDASFITVAHGLSVERQRWPIVFVPEDVETLAKGEQYEQRLPFVYEGK